MSTVTSYLVRKLIFPYVKLRSADAGGSPSPALPGPRPLPPLAVAARHLCWSRERLWDALRPADPPCLAHSPVLTCAWPSQGAYAWSTGGLCKPSHPATPGTPSPRSAQREGMCTRLPESPAAETSPGPGASEPSGLFRLLREAPGPRVPERLRAGGGHTCPDLVLSQMHLSIRNL